MKFSFRIEYDYCGFLRTNSFANYCLTHLYCTYPVANFDTLVDWFMQGVYYSLEVYLGPCQTAKMEPSVNIVNGF